MNDSDFQDLSTVHSPIQKKPPTIASAATIAPTMRCSFISGTTAIATVTPPINAYHELVMIFTAATPTAFTTTGNIKAVATPTQNLPVNLRYNPLEGKYYVSVEKAS